MIYMKAKNIFVSLVIFLYLLEAPAAYADADVSDFVPQKQDEANNDVIEESAQLAEVQIVLPDTNAIDNSVPEIIDDARLELLAQTLIAEKQRLAELELEHEKLLDEIMAQPQQDYTDKGDTLTEEHLLTTVRQDTVDSSSRNETFEHVPEIDFNDLKPEGNVDLLGTADGLYKLLQYEAALQIYRSIDPEKTSKDDYAWILCQITNCCRNLNQFDNALNTCQELLAKYPDTYPAKEAQWYLESLNWWKQWYEKANVALDVKETTKPQLPLSNAEGK